MLVKTELWELLEIAKHAASLAAAIHRNAMVSGSLEFDTKSSTSDLVTEIDRESERVLVEAIRVARPNDASELVSVLVETGVVEASL